DLFPHLAGRPDKLALVRTLTTQSNDHGIAGTIGLTGSGAGGTGLDGKPLPGSPRPALGAVVAKARAGGGRAGSSLHPFFVIGGGAAPGEEGDHPRGGAARPGPPPPRPRPPPT